MLLASCGGGGGGSSNNEELAERARQEVNAYKALAQARPRPGSVTQSSFVGDDNVTSSTEVVKFNRQGESITVSKDNEGSATFDTLITDEDYYARIGTTYGDNGYADIEDSSGNIILSPASVEKGIYERYYERYLNLHLHGPDSYEDLEDADVVTLMVRETDYLTLGHWFTSTRLEELRNTNIPTNMPFDPSDPTAQLDYYEERIEDISLFVIGGRPYEQNNIPNIRGTVNYSGSSVRFGGDAVYISRHGPYYENVDINLVANFGNSSELGSIRGTITNVRARSGPRSTDNIVSVPGSLILEESPIGNSHSGFFEGDVSGNLDDLDWTGKWGGQFYSHDDVGIIPGTVAGTMAASSLNGEQAFAYAWYADFESISTAFNQGPGYLAPGQSQASPIDPQELANSFISPGGAMGDALGNSIGQQQVTGFSQVPGVTFNLNGDSFVGATPGASLAASLNSFMAPSDWTIPEQWQFSLKPLHLASRHGTSLEQGKGLFHLASPQGWAASFHTQGVEVAYNPSEGPFTFTAGAVHEPDSLLGTQVKGIFGSLAADTFYMGSRWQTDMGQWSIAAGGELGLVSPTVAGSSVIDRIDTLTTNAFTLEAARDFNNGNTLRFSLSQPLRVAAGSMKYIFANGSQDGLVTGQSHSASLTPSGRQLDFTTALDVPLREGELSLGLTMSTEPGHKKGADSEVDVFTAYQARW